MKSDSIHSWLTVAAITLAATLPLRAQQRIEPPEGALIERNIDIAAERAIDKWIGQLLNAPHTDQIQNIGILRLRNDQYDFTTLLAQKLSALERFNVVILAGTAPWMAIEDQIADQDPDAGFGDIMDKATIVWRETRDGYKLPETTKGADALLIGAVRSVDKDWLRARVRLTPYLARVGTREQIAGGIVEGESTLDRGDLVIYYKNHILIGIIGLVVVIVILAMLGRVLKAMTRVR